MKTGRTLMSLAEELTRQLGTKKDLIVPSVLLSHRTNDGVARLLPPTEN